MGTLQIIGVTVNIILRNRSEVFKTKNCPNIEYNSYLKLNLNLGFEIGLSSIPDFLQYSELQLCAKNMIYYHWLTKNLLQPMAGQNISKLEI